MEPEVARLVKQFEAGTISRRDLIVQLTTVTTAMAGIMASAQETPSADSTFKATSLNHIALSVTDVDRSRDFYAKHLGLKVSRESPGSNCFMNFGDNFLALFRAEAAGMNHYCYSVKGYKVRDAVEKLKGEGLKPRNPGGSGRVYFDDPDGLEVQLAAESHAP